ncbi:MAG: class I lanthipeptide [Pyrinomonadaceae bacterium]
MVTKKSTSKKAGKKGRVKVAKLTLNKESVKDLTASQRKQIKGGKAKAIISLCTCGEIS